MGLAELNIIGQVPERVVLELVDGRQQAAHVDNLLHVVGLVVAHTNRFELGGKGEQEEQNKMNGYVRVLGVCGGQFFRLKKQKTHHALVEEIFQGLPRVRAALGPVVRRAPARRGRRRRSMQARPVDQLMTTT